MVIGAIITIGRIVYKVAKGTLAFGSGATSIVSRFPPNFRPYIKDVIKGANIVTAGGLISDIIHSEWEEYGTIQKIKRPKADKFQKKYQPKDSYNHSGRYGYNAYNKRRKSYACISPNRSSRRRRYR